MSLGESKCLFCQISDKQSNLSAAGTLHAQSNKVCTSHVSQFTETLQIKALKLNETQVVTAISTGDITANDIYYHKKCLMWFNNKYSAAIKQETATPDNPSEKFFEELHFWKIIHFVKEQCNIHRKFSFVVAELQSMYNELLKSDKINVSLHASQFTERLLGVLPKFKLQKLDRKNTITYSQVIDLVKNKLKEINQSSLVKALLKVVLPIRK